MRVPCCLACATLCMEVLEHRRCLAVVQMLCCVAQRAGFAVVSSRMHPACAAGACGGAAAPLPAHVDRVDALVAAAAEEG